MKAPAIRKIVDAYSLEQLESAEAALLDGNNLDIAVDGDDEGEQLTHITAAIWIRKRMAEASLDSGTALREFMQRVRDSIN